MRAFYGAILALLVAATCLSADIHLPPAQAPIPAIMPSTAGYILPGDDLLFIGADQATVIRVAPEGLLEFEEVEAGTHHWKSGGIWKKHKTDKPTTYRFSAVGKGIANVEFFWAEGGAVKTKKIAIECLGARPPPTPPDPKPPEPKPPEPVKSFRVIFVYESADLLTSAQKSIVYGTVVEGYLSNNCTDGKAGWRRRDKDGTGGKDTEVMNNLWAAVKPKITATPCVAVEVNGKVEIIPLEATPAAMIAVFDKYRGVK